MLAENVKPSVRLQNSSRFRVRQRYPTKLQWDALRKHQSNFMELETFLQLWQVSHKELAQICLCSVDTVERWFVTTHNNRKPTIYHKLCLSLANKLWINLLSQEGS
jgi:hypothetical protein